MDSGEPHLIDALPDGVVVADADGVVVAANAVAVRWLGPGGLVGRPLSEALRLQNNEGCTWTSFNTPYAGLRTRVGVPEQTWSLASGDDVLTTARISRDEAGAVTQVAVSLRSGRGRERLDRERSDLVATVAHELRSPLTGVKGFVQAMLSRWEVLSNEQKRLMLTTVNSDADRLSRLITELLDVARIDTGRLSLYPRPVEASVVAGRVVASVVAATSRPVTTSVPDDLPLLRADPDRLVQVLTNLLENAVRHGDGTVHLDAADEGDHVRLTVDDEGGGIPEESRRRVFTKFWQFGTAGGSGLGLYIVAGLVAAHEGTVEIGDRPGGGARVVVRWPVADELVD